MDTGKRQHHNSPHRRLVGRYVRLLIASILVLVPAFGQAQELVRDLSQIRVYPETEAITESTRFYIYIEMPEEYTTGLSIYRPANTDRMRYYSGPVRQTTFSNPDLPEGTIRYRYTFTADVAGYSELDGFTMRWPGQTLVSDDLLIPITADGISVPPELEWNLPEEPVYEGQTVFISLDMHRAKEVILPGSLQVNSAGNGILEEVTGLGEWSQYEFAGQTFNRIPLATFLYTPLNSGRLVIPSAEAGFDGYRRDVSSQTLEVLAVPGTSNEDSGAVGNFQLEYSEIPPSIEEGGEFLFQLTVRGTGSLGVLRLPNIEVENGSIEGRDQESDFVPTESGYSGTRTQTYRIRAELPGQLRIQIPDFSWFNPQLARFERISPRQLLVPVTERLATEEDVPRFDSLPLPEPTQFSTIFPLNFTESWIGAALYLLIIPVMFIVITVLKHWSNRTALWFLFFTAVCTAVGLGIFLGGEPVQPGSDTLESFLDDFDPQAELGDEGHTLLEEYPQNARLLFALAQHDYATGEKAEALFHLRTALSRYPLNTEIRAAVTALENEMELYRQFPVPRMPHRDWAFLVMYVSFFIFLMYVVAVDFRLRFGSLSIVRILLFLLIFAVASGMLISYNRIAEGGYAFVIDGGAMLKKIPDGDAADWVFLPEGTMVHVGVESSEFYQIETSYGIIAWISAEEVYLND